MIKTGRVRDMSEKNANNNNRIMRRNYGVTMVELIVTFALLAIFLAAATMCISHAIIFFFDEQQRMSSYTVADVVLSELKDEIRTMQASDEGRKGYVKLRKGASGPDNDGNIYTGTTIEYIASSINDGLNAVQIDVAGCDDYMIMVDKTDKELKFRADKADIKSDYLTMRYYEKTKETNNTYDGLCMDRIINGTYAAGLADFSTKVNSDVVWHASEKLPKELYQNHTIDLQFSVKPRNDEAGNLVVDYVDVTVFVKSLKDDGTSETVYQKERRIDLQNTVYYKPYSEPTLYSDVTAP